MATGADVIKGALRRLQVIEDETPISASEIQDGLEDLNDWGSALEVGKLALGFVPLSNISDEVNIPRGAVGMYKDNLAIYMAGQYGAPIAQTLAQSARDTMNQALSAFQTCIVVEYPDTLPIGSGNDCDFGLHDDKFFPGSFEKNF